MRVRQGRSPSEAAAAPPERAVLPETARLQRLAGLREVVLETVVDAYLDDARRSLYPGISDAEVARAIVGHVDPGVYEGDPVGLVRSLAQQCARMGLLEQGARVNQAVFYLPTEAGIEKVRGSYWHLRRLAPLGVGLVLAAAILLLLGT